jgi:hypothetical protein
MGGAGKGGVDGVAPLYEFVALLSSLHPGEESGFVHMNGQLNVRASLSCFIPSQGFVKKSSHRPLADCFRTTHMASNGDVEPQGSIVYDGHDQGRRRMYARLRFVVVCICGPIVNEGTRWCVLIIRIRVSVDFRERQSMSSAATRIDFSSPTTTTGPVVTPLT